MGAEFQLRKVKKLRDEWWWELHHNVNVLGTMWLLSHTHTHTHTHTQNTKILPPNNNLFLINIGSKWWARMCTDAKSYIIRCGFCFPTYNLLVGIVKWIPNYDIFQTVILVRYVQATMGKTERLYVDSDWGWQVIKDFPGGWPLSQILQFIIRITLLVFVQLLSCVQLFVTPWTAAGLASLSYPTPGVCSSSCRLTICLILSK